MAIIEYPIKVVLLTIADNADFQKILNELNKHGIAKGGVFKEDGKLKGGVILWKHKKTMKKDEYILIIISGVPSIKEAFAGEGLAGLSRRGLFNLKKFNENYPKIPFKDIGVFINAKEIVDAAYGKVDEKALKKIAEQQKGITKRDLKIGCIITESDADFNKFYEELKPHTSNNELLKIDEFYEEDDIGVIFWHHEKPGLDEYWVFLVLDKDTLKEGKLIDWKGPNIGGFIKEYGDNIPAYKLPLLKTGMAYDISNILKKLEKKKK